MAKSTLSEDNASSFVVGIMQVVLLLVKMNNKLYKSEIPKNIAHFAFRLVHSDTSFN